MSKVLKWRSHEFQTSCGKTPEFLKLAREFKSEFKENIQAVNLVIERIDVSHFEISGFVKNSANNKFVYFKIGDVRYFFGKHWLDNILVRVVAGIEDHSAYTSRNQYTDYVNLPNKILELIQ